MTYYQCDKCKLQKTEPDFIKRLFLEGEDAGEYRDLCADCRDRLRAWLAEPYPTAFKPSEPAPLSGDREQT